jgi:DNA ligase 1
VRSIRCKPQDITYNLPWLADEQPSVWLEPCQVWEIRGAELTVSPVHKAAAGLVDSEKGLSLRFPR